MFPKNPTKGPKPGQKIKSSLLIADNRENPPISRPAAEGRSGVNGRSENGILLQLFGTAGDHVIRFEIIPAGEDERFIAELDTLTIIENAPSAGLPMASRKDRASAPRQLELFVNYAQYSCRTGRQPRESAIQISYEGFFVCRLDSARLDLGAKACD